MPGPQYDHDHDNKAVLDAILTAPAPLIHASNHTDGTDDIQSATNAQKGVATAAHITAIEANTSHSTGNGSDHADVATNTTHRGLTNNPHATDIENLGAGTLAELNAALTDATLLNTADERFDLPIVPNDTQNIYWAPDTSRTVTVIYLWAVTKPSSAAGTYTLAITKNGTTTMLNAATVDLDGTLTNLQVFALTLTGTAADLIVDGTSNDYVKMSLVSNNADLAGAALQGVIRSKAT